MPSHKRAREVTRRLIDAIKQGATSFRQGGVELMTVFLCDGSCDDPAACKALADELTTWIEGRSGADEQPPEAELVA